MDTFPVVRDPGSIELLLKHIRSAEAPALADAAYMREKGFRREGDNALTDLLVFLGFIEGEGTPSDLWHAYREDPAVGSRLLAAAVRTAYSELFQMCPRALDLGVAEVVPHLRRITSAPDTELTLMYYTFRVLCDLAEPAIRDKNLPKLGIRPGKIGPQAEAPRPAAATQKPGAAPRQESQAGPARPQQSAAPAPAPAAAVQAPTPAAAVQAQAHTAPSPAPGGVTVTRDQAGGMRISIVLDIDAAMDPTLAELARQLAARAMAAELQRGKSS